MPHRLPLALLVAALALSACGGDDGGDSQPPPTTTTPAPEQPQSQRGGVELSLDRDTPHPGEAVQLTVENTTRTRLEYGLVFRLERRVDGEWRWINRDAAFALILKVVEPGKREREDIRLDDDLRPGRYRIVKSFMAPATGRELEASIEFIVSVA